MKMPIESTPLSQVKNLEMERQRLLSSTNKYKQALEEQVSDLKESTIRVAIQGLVFGGVALGSYFLVKAFQKKEKPEKIQKTEAPVSVAGGFTSTILASIQSYIASFLLAIAREKITEFLEKQFLKQNENSTKNSSGPGL
jgi:hypothetical protein